MLLSQIMHSVNCSSPISEIAETRGSCHLHSVFSVVILTYLSLRDFFTLVFLYTVSVAGGCDKLEGTNTTNSDIVRLVTCVSCHIGYPHMNGQTCG